MDRIKLVREYRKAWWICGCGQEDFTDLNVGTPSVYEHNCSKCNKWSNSFKEYQGVISYSPDNEPKEEDVVKDKEQKIGEWVYAVKNPAPYIEPTKEDLEKQKIELEAQVANLAQLISSKSEAIEE